MPIFTALIATLTTTAYLAAALLPCEPPDAFVERRARPASSHALPSTPPGHTRTDTPGHAAHHAPVAPEMTGVASHAAAAARPDGGGAGHPAHAGHDHARSHGESHDPIYDESHEPVRASASTAGRFAQSELLARCLCGCSETRAFVGGGAARLGAVVPGVYVARLPEAIGAVPLDGTVLSRLRVDHEIDPIPI